MPWVRARLTTLLRLGLGLGIVAVAVVLLMTNDETQHILTALGSFPLITLAVLLLASFLVSLLKAARFHILVRHVDIEISFWKTLRLFLVSQAATPIPAGETIRAALLKHETGAPLGKVAAPVLGQAVYEIAAALSIVLVASFFYPELFVPTLTAVVCLFLFIWTLLHRKLFNALLRLLSYLPAIKHQLDRLKRGRDQLRQNFSLLEGGGLDRHVVMASLFAFLAQLMGGLLVLVAATAFDIQLNFLQFTLVYASGALLQGLFTLIPGGLGVTEGGMSGVLHLLGVELSLALALVLIVRFATLVFPVVLGLVLMIPIYFKKLIWQNL